MWIISNSLLESWNGAPDTAALEWDSSELSEMCAQSLTRRSNFLAAKSWSRVWKTGKSTLPQFGRILKPSHANAFEEWWIASLPGTPASPSVHAATAKAPRTKKDATCGPSFKGQLQLFDQDSASLRMSQDILPLGLATSCTTFRNWVLKLRRDCSRRVRRACRTRGKGCSSWPTIRAQEPGWTSDGYGDNLVKRMARSTESARPTPRSSEYKDVGPVGSKSHDHMLGKHYLCATVTQLESTSPPPAQDQSNTGGNPPESWATPQTSDHHHTFRNDDKTLRRDLAEAFPNKEKKLNHEGNRSPKLSPRWVEALMGLPIGWTDPTCSRPITPWEAVCTRERMSCAHSETE